MMPRAEIIPFEFESNAVRTVVIDDQPWFVAADVCRLLEHSNSRMALKRLDGDERGVTKVYTLGGEQEMNIISESGLYALIVTSNIPTAKRFRKWVTAEVLPALRRHGRYEMAEAAVPESHQIGAARYIRLLEAERDDAKQALAAAMHDHDLVLAVVREWRTADFMLWRHESLQAGTFRPRRISPVEQECISLLLNHGYTPAQISQVTGRNQSSIRKHRAAIEQALCIPEEKRAEILAAARKRQAEIFAEIVADVRGGTQK